MLQVSSTTFLLTANWRTRLDVEFFLNFDMLHASVKWILMVSKGKIILLGKGAGND